MASATFCCNLSATTAPLPHFWEHSVGSCHAPLALRADWQAQLRRCRDELGFRGIRFHGLLCDDLGTLVRHGEQLVYSFFNLDRIFDFVLSLGMQPLVELSFMPTALASGPETIFHYHANVSPPKDLRQWAELMRRLAAHCVQRYGAPEVRTWLFEVWNEPNLPAFWAGTQKDYFELYRHTVTALKETDDRLQVGGPATARNEWVEEFLDFCATNRLPADFVSTHQYPNDPLWSEKQDTEGELAGSRRGVMRQWAVQVQQQARGLPVYYTEWNASSNPRYPRQDEPYAAAFIIKTVLDMSGLVDGYSFWTFSDIFEENYFPSVPFHGGFGLLNLYGIPKPAYRAFELLHRLGTEQLPVQGRHDTVDVWATRSSSAVTVLLANHALPRQPIETVHVQIELADAERPLAACLERIDDDHANAKRHWQALGEPEYLDEAVLDRLQSASRLVSQPWVWKFQDRVATFEVVLPPHGVAALVIELAGAKK